MMVMSLLLRDTPAVVIVGNSVTLPTVYERGWRGRERYDEGNMIVLIK